MRRTRVRKPLVRPMILGLALLLATVWGGAPGHAAELMKPGTWSGGSAVGFLGNTPDGTAAALNFHADGFLARNFSLGPLLQLGLTEDLTQIGFSGQGKLWIDLPGIADRAKLVLQGGLGFVHADFRESDTSWLIPLGVGLDYKLNDMIGLTATFLLNFTDLDTGPGSNTNVMPGLTFGVRF